MNSPFPQTPSIRLYDPLADLLGAGDGLFHYRFDDVVKLSGHACPTVAGAFLMAIRALGALYGEETPSRGGIEVTISGAEDQGVNGPISQVFTLLTGAAGRNGFQGLGSQHNRQGLLRFEDGTGFGFRRRDNGARVRIGYDPSAIPPPPGMMPLMQRILQGESDPALRQEFRAMWRERVVRILEDAGEQTVTLTAA
ncbi:MAG: hypothetical protein KJ558_02500 [Gammaproteobacteria bacterium]|nr:hypothetical protein [Gammaproteobacteria bacterium]MBU1653697.1 hypothetical protein [Gammaproteobacteria bacterium]MBU1960908.1 hypothetical protein [Gammaproteobacteria bacterium]